MDKGIASLGVLVLFTVSAVLLAVGLPVIKSDAALKVSDWLGFAGNIIAAVLAAAAATVAWLAAQRQIKQAVRQNSVIAYGALREIVASINADSILNHKVAGALAFIEAEPERMRKQPSLTPAQLEFHYIGVYQSLKELQQAEIELQQRRANPWGNAEHRSIRKRLIEVIGAYSLLTYSRMQIFQHATSQPVNCELAISQFQRGSIEEESLEVATAASDRLREAIEGEMKRTYALMDRHFEGVTALG